MKTQVLTAAPALSNDQQRRDFRGIILSITLLLLPSLFNILPLGKSTAGTLAAQTLVVHSTGTPGDVSAMLDVNAINKGVLITRIALTSSSDVLTIPTPATSLLIYNTATAGGPTNNVSPGYYYWNGVKWITLGSPLAFSDFYALMPGDNTATIALGAAIEFPQTGPTNGIITRPTATQFLLPAVGTYMVTWQASIQQAGQLALELNGNMIAYTVVGRATGTSQIIGSRLITTTETNSLLRVINPAGNPEALTLTPTAGGASAVSASIVITRVQ